MTGGSSIPKLTTFRDRWAAEPGSGVFIALADLLREQGAYEEALVILGEGMAARPESVSACVVMGRTLLESGSVAEGRNVLRAALERDGDNVVALRLLAEAARAASDWEESLPHLERLMLLDPDDDRWRAAAEEAREFRDAPPRNQEPSPAGFATMTLVDILLAQGYNSRALDALRQMAVSDPARHDVLERIAELEARGPLDEKAPLPAEESGQRTERRHQVREQQRDQFAEWLDKISRPGQEGK